MLFLVISTPSPDRPSDALGRRRAFWKWIDLLVATGQVKSAHAKAGRGAAVMIEVAGHDALHSFLNEWSEMIPAHFEIHPLMDERSTKRFLET